MPRRPQSGTWERVRRALQAATEPQTVAQLAKATGFERTEIHQALRVAHAVRWVDSVGAGKSLAWSLRVGRGKNPVGDTPAGAGLTQDDLRERALALLAKGPLPSSALCAALGTSRVNWTLQTLVDRKLVELVGEGNVREYELTQAGRNAARSGRDGEPLVAVDAPTDAQGRPMWVRGAGDRREDCAQYDGCLTRFTKSGAKGSGHCPAGCSHFTPARQIVDLRRTSNLGLAS